MSCRRLPPTRVGRVPEMERGLTAFARAVARRVPSIAPTSRNRIRALREAARRNGRLDRAFREIDQARCDG